MINRNYNEKLQELELSDGAVELLSFVLEDLDTATYRTQYLYERATLLKQLEEQDALISRARKLFIADKLKFDDFSGVKEEYRISSDILKREINTVMIKLKRLDQYITQTKKSLENVFNGYQYMDAPDKKKIISLIHPVNVDIQTGSISLSLNSALAKIFRSNIHSCHDELLHTIDNDSLACNNYYFANKKITIKKAVIVLIKNNIQVSDEDATIILDFLYHIAQCYNKRDALSLSRYRTNKK
jgi:hypothetical protein